VYNPAWYPTELPTIVKILVERHAGKRLNRRRETVSLAHVEEG